MIQALVFIEAEPSRVQELVSELAGMELASSVIKQVYAVTGRYDLVALIESPDISSLGDWVSNGIGGAVGVRRTETSLIVWSQPAPNSANALNQDLKKNTEKAEQLREGVRLAYSAVAEDPQMKHPFPVGREFAKSLGYPPELIASLPAVAVDAFAGVSNVSIFADIPKAATVLDLGCGTGLDSLIAARKVGPEGHVIGVDFSQTMLARARQAAVEAGIGNVEFCRADAETLRLKDASIDVALVNGIFNLNPARASIFSELARVMRPGGTVYAAEIILREPLPPEVQESEANWFAWIAGAKEGGTFLSEFKAAGFAEVKLLRTLRNARTKNPNVLAAEVYACR